MIKATIRGFFYFLHLQKRRMGIFKRFFSKEKLDKGLEPTKQSLIDKIGKAVAGKSTVDASVLDQLEEVLISADIGVDTTLKIIDLLEKRVAKDKYMNSKELHLILRDEITTLLDLQEESPRQVKPRVTLVVGVNGVGKTTTIGKLAHLYHAAGQQVLLGAADTFRAAAVDQLTMWSERVGVPIVKQQMGSDPASVAYDSVASGLSQGVDHVIIDTSTHPKMIFQCHVLLLQKNFSHNWLLNSVFLIGSYMFSKFKRIMSSRRDETKPVLVNDWILLSANPALYKFVKANIFPRMIQCQSLLEVLQVEAKGLTGIVFDMRSIQWNEVISFMQLHQARYIYKFISADNKIIIGSSDVFSRGSGAIIKKSKNKSEVSIV